MCISCRKENNTLGCFRSWDCRIVNLVNPATPTVIVVKAESCGDVSRKHQQLVLVGSIGYTQASCLELLMPFQGAVVEKEAT